MASTVKRRRLSGKVHDRIECTILYILLVLIAACFILPVLFMFLSSFKTSSELFQVPMKWLPSRIQFDNYKGVFDTIPFWTYLKNTVIIVFFNIIGSVFSSAFVAYGFSRLRWKWREKVFAIVLVTMILPYQVTLIPQYIIFSKLNWVGTFLPLTVTCFFGNSMYIFLMRQFFLGIPIELSEAARIDGSGEFRIFAQILLPCSRPVLVTVGVFAFLKTWNDYVGPLVFLSDQKLYTLSLGAKMLQSNLDPNWDLLMALGSMMVLPVLIIFFCLQKYFIQGVTMSGIKG